MSGAITSIEDDPGRSGWFPPEGAGSGFRLVCRRVADGIPWRPGFRRALGLVPFPDR